MISWIHRLVPLVLLAATAGCDAYFDKLEQNRQRFERGEGSVAGGSFAGAAAPISQPPQTNARSLTYSLQLDDVSNLQCPVLALYSVTFRFDASGAPLAPSGCQALSGGVLGSFKCAWSQPEALDVDLDLYGDDQLDGSVGLLRARAASGCVYMYGLALPRFLGQRQ
jgi:hypothetical protein